MQFTDARAWLDAHELIECKPLKGRWTRETCLEISKRARKAPKNAKSRLDIQPVKTVPCVNCPILAALEK